MWCAQVTANSVTSYVMSDASAAPQRICRVEGLRIKPLDDRRAIERLRVLDKTCFPVSYTDSYYDKVFECGWNQHSFIAIFNDALVGSITCRLEPADGSSDGSFHPPPKGEPSRLYIMTLGVLSAYRKLGIGAVLMDAMMKHIADIKAEYNVAKIALHVQEGSPAHDFYKKFGFEVSEKVPNYYTNIEPTCDALILTKAIEREATPAPGKKK